MAYYTNDSYSYQTSTFSSSINNGTDNNRTRFFAFSPYTPLTMILTAIPIVFIIIVIVFGNALVVLAVLSQERLKKKTQNWLIVSLAVADLLVGLLIMPFTLTYELLGRWTFGRAFCEMWLASDVLFVTASILNLCAISIDRYWSLTDPVHYSATMKTPKARIRILVMIACSWLLSFIICSPPLIGWRPDHGDQNVEEELAIGGTCNVSGDVGYVLYSALGSFFVPMSIVLFIYVKIFFLTRRRITAQRRKAKQRDNLLSINDQIGKKESVSQNNLNNCKRSSSIRLLPGKAASSRQKNSVSTSPAAPVEETCETSFENNTTASNKQVNENNGEQVMMAPSLLLKPLELQLRMMQQRKGVRRRERQATLVLGLILGTFILSWMPFFCSYVLSALCCQTPELIFDIIFWLGYCNSGLNPFIYNFFNPDFRCAFQRILCRKK